MICSRSFLSFPFSLELMTSSTVDRVYQGQFGEFTITDSDRLGVRLYRLGLNLAAFSFAVATIIVLTRPQLLPLTNLLYIGFCLGLGISLLTIHIYLIPLHRLLQVFWLIGAITSLIFSLYSHLSPLEFAYNHPVSLFGVGFIFANQVFNPSSSHPFTRSSFGDIALKLGEGAINSLGDFIRYLCSGKVKPTSPQRYR
jgi:hypothetical protein